MLASFAQQHLLEEAYPFWQLQLIIFSNSSGAGSLGIQ
jgi:hypothetical protein